MTIDKQKIAAKILANQSDRAWFDEMVGVAAKVYAQSTAANDSEESQDAWLKCMTWILRTITSFLGEDVEDLTAAQAIVALKMSMDAMVVAIAQQPSIVDGTAAAEALSQRIDKTTQPQGETHHG